MFFLAGAEANESRNNVDSSRAILGGLAVAAGAFGAHGLKNKLDETQLRNFETAARYQMIHALAILFVGLLLLFLSIHGKTGTRTLQLSGLLFFLGTLLFSGSL